MEKIKSKNIFSEFIDTFKNVFNKTFDEVEKVLIQKQEEESLNERMDRIRDSFQKQFFGNISENGIELYVANDFYLGEIYETYVIASNWNSNYKVSYIENADGFKFDKMENWIEVETKWVEVVKSEIKKSDTDAKELQKNRSEKYGIEILEKNTMIEPGIGFSKDENDYADPVNYRYDIHDVTSCKKSKEALLENKGGYKNQESLEVVYNKIIKAMIDLKFYPEINSEKDLDSLIEKKYVEKINKSINKFSKEVKIIKSDDEKRLVYGVVLSPDEVDLQNDTISEEEIEKAAHRYMIMYQTLGKEHEQVEKGASIVESYIAKAEEKHNETTVKKGAWILVTKIHDDKLWKDVKDGNITGYSIGGRALLLEEET